MRSRRCSRPQSATRRSRARCITRRVWPSPATSSCSARPARATTSSTTSSNVGTSFARSSKCSVVSDTLKVSDTLYGVEDHEPAEARAVDLERVAAGAEESGVRRPVAPAGTLARIEPDLGGRLQPVVEAYELRPVKLPAADQDGAGVARVHEPEHLLNTPGPRPRVPLGPTDAERRSGLEAERVRRPEPIAPAQAEGRKIGVIRHPGHRAWRARIQSGNEQRPVEDGPAAVWVSSQREENVARAADAHLHRLDSAWRHPRTHRVAPVRVRVTGCEREGRAFGADQADEHAARAERMPLPVEQPPSTRIRLPGDA